MIITGKITKILDVQTGAKKDGSGDWQKQSFVVETEDKFNNVFCFDVFGEEKVQNLTKYNKVGDVVEVEFNVQTNEYQGKYYTTLQAWKISKSKANGVEVHEAKVISEPQSLNADNEPDDLPFS